MPFKQEIYIRNVTELFSGIHLSVLIIKISLKRRELCESIHIFVQDLNITSHNRWYDVAKEWYIKYKWDCTFDDIKNVYIFISHYKVCISKKLKSKPINNVKSHLENRCTKKWNTSLHSFLLPSILTLLSQSPS